MRPEGVDAVGAVAEVRAAVVQAASVLMDLQASVDRACALIAEARAGGAELIVFPEAFLGGYPRGLSFASVVGSRGPEGRQDWARYCDGAVRLDSPPLRQLAAAIRRAQAFVVMGAIEREDEGAGSTLYGATLYYGPDGRLLGKHRKLKPTGSERLIWGEGDGSTLTVVETPYGRLGGLICWENYMPLARAAMYERGVSLYAAPTADARDSWQASIRHIACEGRCFVLSCNQRVDKLSYPADLACHRDLEQQPEELCRGGSAIVDPLGNYLAGPLYHQEGVLYADLDLRLVTQARFDLDVTGHYARPDVFRLIVDERPRRTLTRLGEGTGPTQP